MIRRCALAVIEKQGKRVIGPSMSPIDAEEESFLRRHVDKLRATADSSNNARGRFRAGSFLEADIQRLLVADNAEFLAIADRHASALAAAMERTSNAKACVMALLVEDRAGSGAQVSLLKLDAEIEAAQLNQTEEGVHLKVYKDLLPKPGDIQKGFSWPDPREPRSSIIVLDIVVAGGSTKYFKDAFELDVSAKAAVTEAALVEELTAMPIDTVGIAIEVADAGGDAEEVVARIREVVPDFAPAAEELGADGALGGRIRPNFSSMATKTFEADGIELKVPLSALGQVVTRSVGGRYETTITTDFPLTPPDTNVEPPF